MIDYTIDTDDLKALFAACGNSIPRGTNFKAWCNETKVQYKRYVQLKGKMEQFPYTYSQWINRQTIALTS
jgi:hypothetical protein